MLIELDDVLWDLKPSAAYTVFSVVILFATQYAFRNQVSVKRKPAQMADEVWTKMLNNNWKCTWHTVLFALEVYELSHLGRLHFVIWPFNEEASVLWRPRYEVSMPSGVAFLFLLQVSYYLSDLLYWLFVKPPSDWAMMTIHHFASGVLICLSGIPWPNAHFWISGLVILTLHEVSDVLLYIAKGMHYLNFSGGDLLLILFAVSWLYFRNIVLSVYVAEIWMLEQFWVEWQYWPCVVLLTLLCVLHAIWFYAILRGLWHALSEGHYVDTRYENISPEQPAERRISERSSTDSLITDSIWQRRLKYSKAPTRIIPPLKKKCSEVDDTLIRLSALPGRDFSCSDSPKITSPLIFRSLPEIVSVKRLKME